MDTFTITTGCVGCGACLVTCPARVIRAAPSGAWRVSLPPLVVLDGCTGCGECAEVCPVDACVPEERSARAVSEGDSPLCRLWRSRSDRHGRGEAV